MRDLPFNEFDVLVVDDEEDNLDAFRFAFRKSFRLHYATSGSEALAIAERVEPAVIVADQRMPGMSGIALLAEVKARLPDCYTILLTAYADLDVLVDAVNSGAVDRYAPKPWDSREFPSLVRQGIVTAVTLRENRALREQIAAYASYLEDAQHDPLDLGALTPDVSAALSAGSGVERRVLDAIEDAAPTSEPVLIVGEPGVESELVARALHVTSPRESRPFVAVMARAFPGEALERELFGWGPSGLSGAPPFRAGRVELAHGGTLWLHDPSSFTPALQARLLRLLTERTSERVGETRLCAADVRLVLSVVDGEAGALEVRDLMPELRTRLTLFPIRLAPLRERRDDIPRLAAHFLERHAVRNGTHPAALLPGAREALMRHDWPDNVRELESVVERAAILARGGDIDVNHLRFHEAERRRPVERVPSPAGAPTGLSDRLDALERSELERAMVAHHGNKAEVARALGVHRTTLYYRLKKFGLDG